MTTLTESPHLPDTCLIRAFRRMSMPSSASRLPRASHTSGSSLDISRPLRSTIVTFAAEAAHRLGHLHSDVAPTENKQVFGNFIEFKSLDMRERLRFRKARNCLQRGPRARTNDHIRAPQLTCGPIGQGDFYCSRS